MWLGRKQIVFAPKGKKKVSQDNHILVEVCSMYLSLSIYRSWTTTVILTGMQGNLLIGKHFKKKL